MALELRADRLLIDEHVGRAFAAKRGLTVVGTLAVLDLAAAKGLLDLREAIDNLLGTNFRAPPALILELLERDAGRKKPRA